MKRFLLTACMSTVALSAFATEIIAHRGASKDAPENTLAAFRLGYEQQADGVELDVYLTKDGKIAVIHDANTKRTAGRDAKVSELTLAELRALDAGVWKGEQWRGEKIPSLEEALALVPEGKKLFVEVKCGPEILPELQRVLKSSGKKWTQLVLISFQFPVVEDARKTMPQLKAYFLAAYKEDKKTGHLPDLDQLAARAKAAGLTGLDLDFKFPIDAAAVAKLKEHGLQLQIWTVDDPEVARRLAAAGVEGITTNRPAFLREQLK